MRYEDIRKMNIFKETMLYKFYDGYFTSIESGNDCKNALHMACYLDGELTFDVKIDVAWFVANEVTATNALSTYDGFKRLIDKGYIEVTLHTKKSEDETTFTR